MDRGGKLEEGGKKREGDRERGRMVTVVPFFLLHVQNKAKNSSSDHPCMNIPASQPGQSTSPQVAWRLGEAKRPPKLPLSPFTGTVLSFSTSTVPPSNERREKQICGKEIAISCLKMDRKPHHLGERGASPPQPAFVWELGFAV